MEKLDVNRGDAEDNGKRVGARHFGLGVVAVMSLKGTATLTAAYLLPSWPLRFLALAILVATGAAAFHRHRRKARSE